jgi:iron complex transport system permease protein
MSGRASRPKETSEAFAAPKPRIWLAALLAILPILFFIVSLCIGRYPVALRDVWASLFQALLGLTGQAPGTGSASGGSGVSADIYAVVVLIRLPRTILCVLVGSALAAAGVAFQGLFRNPLVSSGILGVSSGAGFGAALAILIFNSTLMSPIFAFTFGILAVGLSYMIGRINQTTPTITLVLGGTIVQSMFAALLSLTKYVADTESQLPAITFWLMGSLASTRTSDIWAAGLAMMIGMTGLMLLSWRINVLAMGDREALTLGLPVMQIKLLVIAGATLAAAGAVSVSGVIGWIGLIVPHIGRMLVGNDNRRLLPASMAIGACFLIAIDILCRTLTSSEIPLGIVTALVGGPFFIYLLRKTKGENW